MSSTLEALKDLVKAIEGVFHDDWDFTKITISDANIDDFISASGTFLEPGVGDVFNNWGCRGAFLSSYARAKEAIARAETDV